MPAEVARLSVDDLAAFADEASRMGLSLACLIGALEDGEPILWLGQESHAAGEGR